MPQVLGRLRLELLSPCRPTTAPARTHSTSGILRGRLAERAVALAQQVHVVDGADGQRHPLARGGGVDIGEAVGDAVIDDLDALGVDARRSRRSREATTRSS